MRRGCTIVGLVSVFAIEAASLGGAPVSTAQEALHRVRYTVTSETPLYADIYYRGTDQPNWAAYSHNPYLYSPKIETQIGPHQIWEMEVMLADTDQWAMVAATSGFSSLTPNFRCTIEVDYVEVKAAQGSRGALCSLRTW
ncbi:hypothetical protein BH09ACT8_BH09ACT8_62460 [soil metagenome]